MKSSQLVLLLFALFLFSSISSAYAYTGDVFSQTNQVPLWLILRFKDYKTDMPVFNLSVTVTINTDRGTRTISSVTNETGTIQVSLGDALKGTLFKNKRLQEIVLSNNYTLIKVQNLFIEDVSVSTQNYRAEYVSNFTRHRGLQIDLDYRDLVDYHSIEGSIWVLKGDLFRILDSDPFTGKKVNLYVAPAIKTSIPSQISKYESYYFFPIGHEVTIFYDVRTWTEYENRRQRNKDEMITPIIVKVDENTTLIDWMGHAAQEYADRQTYYMDRELKLLESSGYALEQENEEYQAVKSLLGRVLELYRREEYLPALGGAKISAQKLAELKKWISDLKVLAVLNTMGISLFAYGLAALLSGFVFEEPSENKIRLVTKVLTFSLIMLVFSFSHPSLKIAFAMIIGSRNIDLPISLLGCFIIGGSTYFFIQLLSVRKKSMTDLAVQLGVRSLKRRRSRTILSLVTVTIIVSSAIIFVNISVNRSTKIKEQWRGTNISGVLVKPDTYLAPLSEYDVNWTRAQEWCKEAGYEEGTRTGETTPQAYISRIGMLTIGEETYFVNITGIDPSFMETHYELSKLIRGVWEDFSAEEGVAIVPTTLGILANEPVTLGVDEFIMTGDSTTEIKRTLGEFRVVGTFDPQTAFANLVRIDNTPLFDYPLTMVLVPIKSIEDRAITITDVTVILKEGYDPVKVAEELAYTLAATTVANKDGFAQRIVWSTEFSVAGLAPYMPPLVIAGLMMYTTMVSIYEERRKEFTTLATLGLDPRNTFEVFLVEALLLGLMGTFLGFFGSYLLGAALFYLTSSLGVHGLPAPSLSYTHWSMPAILVAFLTGVVMVFLGAYVPAVRAQDLSLMGRVKRREMIGELTTQGAATSLTLPIRETIQNGDMLYTYIRETIGKFKRSLVDPHSIKGEIYRDGTFKVSFISMGEGYSVTVPCEIKGVKDGEILIPTIEFPTSYRDYQWIRLIIRDLEQYMIGFSAWKDMQMKMTIVREAPRKQKTTEEILTAIKDMIDQIKDCNKKLKILDAQKGKLSEEVYNEFREKYINMIEEKSKSLRSMTVNLEPHHKQLSEEIGKVEVEVERITTAYNLGETSEEEYVKTCGPLQGRLAELKSKVQELEEIFEFLKAPLGMI